MAKKAKAKIKPSPDNKALGNADVFALMGKLEKEGELKSIELEVKRSEDFLSTGCLGLDLVLGGGYYGGQVIQFYGPEHSGKCLVKSSMIHTGLGLLTLEEVFKRADHEAVCTNKVVEFGMPLINRHGHAERSARLFMNGRKPVTRIMTSSGGRIESTANHPHLVMSDGGNWVWRTTAALRPGDYLLRSTAPSFGPEQVAEEQAYLLGALVADAHFGERRLLMTNDDPDVEAVIKSHGPALLGVDPKTYDKTSTSTSYHFNSKEGVTAFYETWGSEVGVARFKRVPSRVRGFDKEGSASFLRGYFDCESFASPTSIEVTSASFELLHDVKLMLQMFGIIGTIAPKVAKNYPNTDYWRLHLTGQDYRSFIEKIGARSAKVKERYVAALSDMEGKEANSRRHSIPNLGLMLRDFYDSNRGTTRDHNRLFYDVMGASPKVRLSYRRLTEILDATETGDWDPLLRARLQEIESSGYFYDQVEGVEDAGEQPVFDVEMPETHSFIANGFVTHNSTLGYTSAAYLTGLGIPVAILDYEGTTDRKYTEQPGIGVNYSRVRYFRPKTGEIGYDFIYNFCDSLPDKHAGLPQAVIFIDTVAAMLPQVWVDDPRNKQPGRDAAMHSLGWKRIQTLISNKHVSIVAMNQIRANVGNPYQAPENLPGGNAWKFATTNLVRVGRGKSVDTPDGRSLQLMRFKTQKNKNFIPLQEVQIHLNLGVGIDIASDVLNFCKLAGYLVKRGKLPSIVGLDPSVDMDFKSGSHFEQVLQEQGREGPIYQMCRSKLINGEAIKKYRESKNTLVTDEGDVSTVGAKREKVKTIAGDEDLDDELYEDDEASEEASEASEETAEDSTPEEDSAPEDEETPALLGAARKKAKDKSKKKKTTKKKSAKKSSTKKVTKWTVKTK